MLEVVIDRSVGVNQACHDQALARRGSNVSDLLLEKEA